MAINYYGNESDNKMSSGEVNLEKADELPPLTDQSPFPFGKHQGVKMENVPASYLHWFYTTCAPHTRNSKQVYKYIENNINALKKEYPDGIWKPNH